jgi:hypothetical protein
VTQVAQGISNVYKKIYKKNSNGVVPCATLCQSNDSSNLRKTPLVSRPCVMSRPCVTGGKGERLIMSVETENFLKREVHNYPQFRGLWKRVLVMDCRASVLKCPK